MADYDLGTAHGKIVIESDVDGTQKAIIAIGSTAAAMRVLGATMRGMDNNVGVLRASLRGLSRSFDGVKASAASVADASAKIGSSFLTAGRRVKWFSETVLGADLSMKAMRSTLFSAIGAFRQMDVIARRVNYTFDTFRPMKRMFDGVAYSIRNIHRAYVPLWRLVSSTGPWTTLGRTMKSLATEGRLWGQTWNGIKAGAKSMKDMTVEAVKIGKLLDGVRKVLKGINTDDVLPNELKQARALARSYRLVYEGVVAVGRGLKAAYAGSFIPQAITSAKAFGAAASASVKAVGVELKFLGNLAAGIGEMIGFQLKAGMTAAIASARAAGAAIASQLGRGLAATGSAISKIGISLLALSMTHFTTGTLAALTAVGRLSAGVRGLAASMALLGGGQAIRRLLGITAIANAGRSIRGLAVAFGAMGLSMRGIMGVGFGGFLGSIASRMGLAQAATRRFGTSLGVLATNLYKSANGVLHGVTAFGLFASAMRDVQKMGKFIQLMMTAMTGGAFAIKLLGGAIMGLANAMKQLSGAAVILPGAIASIGAVGATAALAIKGVSAAFSAGTKEGTEYWEALGKLSPQLQNVAKAVHEFQGTTKELQGIAFDNMFGNNFGDQIRVVGNVYIPMLKQGIGSVASGLREAKVSMVGFLSSASAQSDFKQIFAQSAIQARLFGASLGPALSAFTSVAAVGSNTMTSFAGWILQATTRLDIFTKKASESGQIDRLISDGVQGFKDLGTTIANVGRIFKETFAAFGISGDNALSRMADSTSRFVQTIRDSAQGGALKLFAETLDRVAAAGAKMFGELVNQVQNIVKALQPASIAMSEAFSDHMVTIFKIVGTLLEGIATALSTIPGPAAAAATLALSLGTAMKLVTLAALPFTAFFKFLGAGAFAGMAARNIGAVSASMVTMGRAMNVASLQAGKAGSAIGTGLARAGTAVGSLSKVTNFLLGPWGLAMAAGAYAVYKFIDGQKKMQEAANAASNIINVQAAAVTKFQKALRENVGDQSTSNFAEQAEAEVDSVIKSWERMRDAKPPKPRERPKDEGKPKTTGNVYEMNQAPSDPKADKAYDDFVRAESRLAALDKLKLKNEDLAAAVTGTESAYTGFINGLSKAADQSTITRDEFNLLKEAIDQQRDAFRQARNMYDAQTPGLAKLTEGIRQIAVAGDDATKKANGLKLALDGLFGNAISQTELALKTADAIKTLQESAAAAAPDLNALGDVAMLKGGSVSSAIVGGNANSRQLATDLQAIAEQMRIIGSTKGGDLQGFLQRIQPQLDAMKEKFQLSDDAFNKFLQSVGATPDQITMLLTASGVDETTAKLMALQQTASTIAGEKKTIRFDTNDEQLLAQLKAMGVQIDKIFQGPDGKTTIGADLTVDPAALARITEQIQKAKENGGKGTMPAGDTKSLESVPKQVGAPAPAPTQKVVAPPNQKPVEQKPNEPGKPVETQVKVTGAETVPAEVAKVTTELQKIKPEYQTLIRILGGQDSVNVANQVKGALESLRPEYQTLIRILGETDSNNVVNNLRRNLDELSKTKTDIGMTFRTDGVAEVLDALKTKFDEVVEAIKAKLGEVSGAAALMVSGINSAIDLVVNGVYSRGAKLGQDFADGIRSKKDEVKSAATELADSVTPPLPRSPAKEGPLSGRGYTSYRGRKLAEDFAKGIEAGQASVRASSLGLAGAAQPQLPDAVAAIMRSGGTNLEALRKYGLTPDSDATKALVSAGKAGVTESELQKFLMTGDFDSSGLGRRGLKPSDELVNQLREARTNDKLMSDLLAKNNGKLIDPKEEFEKQFKKWNTTNSITAPFKNAVSGFMDGIRAMLGRPQLGLGNNELGRQRYVRDESVSAAAVAKALRAREVSNIGNNESIAQAVAEGNKGVSDALVAQQKTNATLLENQKKLADLRAEGDKGDPKKFAESVEDLEKTIRENKEQQDKDAKAVTAANSKYAIALQSAQVNGVGANQIPQLTAAQEDQSKKLEALQEAQKARSRADGKTKPEEIAALDAKVTQAQQELQTAQATAARLNADLAQTVRTTLATPGATQTGAGFNGIQGSVSAKEIANAGGNTIGLSILKAVRGQFGSKALSNALNLDHDQDGGLHGQGKAVDIGAAGNNAAEMDQYAKWLFDNRKALGLGQIIYRSPNVGDAYTYYNRNGVEATGSKAAQDIYGEGTMQGHTTHIHAGSDTPINFSGAPALSIPNATVNAPGATTVTAPVADAPKPTTTQQPTAEPRPISEFWDKIAAKESGGNWSNADTGGNGHYGGLQFSPDTWRAFGGTEFAPMPHLATKEQQIEIANRTAFTGYKGTKPQGLGAWEVITNGSTAADGITVDSKPILNQIATNTGISATATAPAQNTLDSLLAGNAQLKAISDKLNNPATDDSEIAQLLQQLDKQAEASPNDKELIDKIKSQAMSDRGFREYDETEGLDTGPIDEALGFAGKIQTMVDGVLKLAKTPMDLYNQGMQTLESGTQAFEMFVRGFSGTKDVNNFIDQVQSTVQGFMSMFQTVTGVVDQFASLLSTAADIAKTVAEIAKAGAEVASAIADVAAVVGSVAGVISGVVGGISAAVGSIDEIIDMAQEAWKIGSRFIGTALSWIAGGLGGPLQGDIKALYDSNTGELQFWDSENPQMKTIYGNGKFGQNEITGEQPGTSITNNIYANPNAPASEIIREQMYAVRAAGNGAYEE